MEIKKIGVVGAGMMGAEIALSFAQNRYPVVMTDISDEFAAKGKEKQAAILSKQVAKGKLSEEEKAEILACVTTSGDIAACADCDLVIEAVLEILEIKTETYKKLEEICKKECIIASNTSSISITKLAAGVSKEKAAYFIGTHFNSPASIMKLVEVVPGILTKPEVTDSVYALLTAIGKEPIRVKDVTGFALNRMFHVFYAEAERLVEEGVCSIEDVDKICLYGLGHPVGIFKLLDNLGHDLNITVDTILYEAYGERFRPSPYMQRLVDAGLYGRKSGEGFYKYE
jgi:3-hydroxybutyryl-CoA dehydrogenase